MSAYQRSKGQRGEREAYHIMLGELGSIVQRRDLSQARDGGGDILIPDARVLVEVKRHKQRSVPTWLEQAHQSALAKGDDWVGVVMWRRERIEWSVFLREQDAYVVGKGYACWLVWQFCDWVRGRVKP